MKKMRTVFFDLDGTLLDTAQDMAYTLNRLREQHTLPELAFADVRPIVGKGAKALVSLAFPTEKSEDTINHHINRFLDLYEQHATLATRAFEGIEKVLSYLDKNNIPWGIVTNKPSRFTFNILKSLDLEHRAACIVCGDTLAKRKPDPEPILYACELLQQEADQCVYLGDSIVDVQSAKAAGMPVIVALYGYIEQTDDPFAWKADGYIRQAEDFIAWLQDHPAA